VKSLELVKYGFYVDIYQLKCKFSFQIILFWQNIDSVVVLEDVDQKQLLNLCNQSFKVFE